MSLLQHLTAWIEPFISRPAPPIDATERRRRQEEQLREGEVALRRLRAELRLMRLWKQLPEREEPTC